MNVTIVDYSRGWPKLFEQERDLVIKVLKVLKVLGKAVARIEHIGSTSVPGLAAKPIVDIMVGLRDFADADDATPKIIALGYTYVKYDDFMERRFFKKINQSSISYHIHMVEVDSPFWERHSLFRDYLRKNPNVAKEYGLLKKKLAKRGWKDTNDYADAKTQFIRKVEEQARGRKNTQ